VGEKGGGLSKLLSFSLRENGHLDVRGGGQKRTSEVRGDRFWGTGGQFVHPLQQLIMSKDRMKQGGGQSKTRGAPL